MGLGTIRPLINGRSRHVSHPRWLQFVRREMRMGDCPGRLKGSRPCRESPSRRAKPCRPRGREAGTMVRGAITRIWSAAGAIAVAAALTLGSAPAAHAAPKAPPKPTSIQIKGNDLPGTLIVAPTDGARLFDTLLA